ncbi:Polysaccharide deacetylase [Pseudoxanthomonas sp. YR558]|nr:Polysaccharide deacetylase [Pseudoxanthomonas sp. YR558]
MTRGSSISVAARVGRRQLLARWCHRLGALPFLQRVRPKAHGELRVLAYHRVLESQDPQGFSFDPELISASAEDFRQQMQHLKTHFVPMRFDQVVDLIEQGKPLPEGAALVTFDDGYDDNYRIAFPILRELGMSAMFFVSTGHIDSGRPYAYDWLVHMLCSAPAGTRVHVPELDVDWTVEADLPDRRRQAADLLYRVKLLDDDGQAALVARLESDWGIPRAAGHPDCKPMTWDQLREMQRGGMEIGSHGVDHRMLAKLPLDRMVAEVQGSKDALERELGVPVQVISYPVGGPDAFNHDTVEAVRSAGFRLACSYVAGIGRLGPRTQFSLPRLPVERHMDMPWFKAMMAMPELFTYASRLRTG